MNIHEVPPKRSKRLPDFGDVTLTLGRREFLVLLAVSRAIGGDTRGPRAVFDEIHDFATEDLGFTSTDMEVLVEAMRPGERACRTRITLSHTWPGGL